MGTPSDPTEPDYEDGNTCEACEASIFNDHTPKYVSAHFDGYDVCAPFVLPDFSGPWILRQDADAACIWELIITLNGDDWDIRWEISTGDAGEESRLSVGLDAAEIWNGEDASKCVSSFSNEQTCPGGFTGEGTGAIRWGPEIDEDAYDDQFP